MSKKVSKQVTEVKTVKVKIAVQTGLTFLKFSERGAQVEMSEKDKKAVDQGLKAFERAQKILLKYYQE